jgi:hypothetical protein
MIKFLFILPVFFALACNVTKRLPENEKLYTGAAVKVEGKDISKKKKKSIKNDLETFIRPKPNTSILGVKYKLWIYQVAGNPKKRKGLATGFGKNLENLLSLQTV